MKNRYSVMYLYTSGSVEILQYQASDLLELTSLLIEYLVSKNCCDLIPEEKAAIVHNFNLYTDEFPLIAVENTVNVWSFSLVPFEVYVFKMSYVISR